MPTQRCLIFDFFALTYRAYFSLPTTIRSQEGTAINSVLGFYNTVSKLLNQIQPHFAIIASDCPDATFRHKLFAPYKAQRPPMPPELRAQLPLLNGLVAAMGMPTYQMAGFEADDIIGTLSLNLPPDTEAYIVTNDRDVLQLVNDRVSIVVPHSRDNRLYTPDTVRAEFGVGHQQIPDLKALMGDSSDNIPGVPGVGPKTAVKWLNRFETLESIIAHRAEFTGRAGKNLRAHQEEVALYKELTTIRTDVPICFCWRHSRLRFDAAVLRQNLESIGIRAPLPQTG